MRLLTLIWMVAALAAAQSVDQLEPLGTRVAAATYRGKSAVHVTAAAGQESREPLALVKGSAFADGTIEADIAGTPAPGAPEAARGFVGIGFRSTPDAGKFELFYLRPTNGRAPDQLRRNHSTQYVSVPDWPWNRTRAETPGLYESYVDLEPGAWTHVKIVVEGAKAQLFVNGAAQPCLIVNDLKLGTAKGAVGLWIGLGTEAYFANLRIVPAK
jgi:hypothetical protein